MLSTSAKNRCVLRVERLLPTLAPDLRDFPRKLRVHYGFHSLRPQTIFDGYTLAITDTSGCAYGVGPLPFRFQPDASACYSEPSMPVCFVPSSNRTDDILSAPFLPPIEEEAAYIPSPGHVPFIHRLRRYAHPRPRCAVRRCTDSTPAVGQPLHSLRVCLRLRARAGRHIVLVQVHDKVPVAPCLHDTCRLL